MKIKSRETLKGRYGEIKKLYRSGLSIREIAKKVKVSQKTVWNTFQKCGLQARKSTDANRTLRLNQRFFRRINTEEKAYMLGFIFADGYVCQETRTYCMAIELNEKDIELLKKFKKLLQAETKLRFNRGAVKLRCHSEKLVEDLAKYGCVSPKSNRVRFPYMYKKFNRHFIRGVFDGDGCVTFNDGNIVAYICGDHTFLEEVKARCPTNGATLSLIDRKSNHARVYWYCKNAEKFLKWLYKDAKIFMKRKHDKFINYMKTSKH